MDNLYAPENGTLGGQAPDPAALAASGAYGRVLVAFSGGKDSLACLLHLLDVGVDPAVIELWHHDIDGGGTSFMDWRCTPGYCRAVADAFGIPIYFSYREGGFLREMLRKDSLTAPVVFGLPGGGTGRTGGTRGTPNTRMQYPQVAADLNVRWCSSKLKIDVMDCAIRNQERFDGSRTLVVTGERAQESANRARYSTFEPHRSSVRKRQVDHWRPIHSWGEAEVWDLIEARGVVPHVAYRLGWSRLSCMTCIFGDADQWATIRAVFPDRFDQIADYERAFGKTIHRTMSVHDLADRGTPYPAALANPELVEAAARDEWLEPVLDGGAWALPAGAFGKGVGPT
jgi:3'-phosphoadenosine 5'-phosphosulfate sulfotransferase (PAPS reductase)/FAD synthetase